MKTAMLFLAVAAFSSRAMAFGRMADIQVLDRTTGETLQVYLHDGRRYIVGEPGHEYQVALTNREGGRLMAVGSVDGVNIVSGETAAVNQNGYVLAPRQQMAINGWRTSLQETAAFYFTTVADSYAARTGRPDDLGVIGFALFREKSHCCAFWRGNDVEKKAREESDARNAAPAASEAGALAQKDERVGTGYGRSEYSEVAYTDFEPASSSPDETLTLYYDSYRNLCKQGVIPARPKLRWHRPQPFPGGFVPAP